ncbi:hypothetical protein E2C01_075021 [Portunus trituberculatus]|uniref:Uncharacterized protein n=1 Tax=Portunus trituberculatus TaxID=210409 RepID=A0A5B7I4Y7_PORTR|nr:hypothetical protein [Portunus trituberculatus]
MPGRGRRFVRQPRRRKSLSSRSGKKDDFQFLYKNCCDDHSDPGASGGDAQAKHPSVWLPCTMQGMGGSSLAPGMPRTLSTKTRAAAGGLLAYTCPDPPVPHTCLLIY